MYGYRKDSEGKFTGDNNAFQVANVACIAKSEMMKPIHVREVDRINIKLAVSFFNLH